MLRKVGHYNNLSKFPKLPPRGTKLSYRYKTLEFDTVTGKPLYPHQITIPPTCNYYDESTGEWKPIGLIEAIDEKGLIRVRKVRFYPQQEAGHLHIVIGNSVAEDALAMYLEMASFVDHGDGRIRDENVPLIFEKVDFSAEAKAKRLERKQRVDALIAAGKLEGAALIQAALVLGVYKENYEDEDEIREAVEAVAESNPKHFIECLNDPLAEAKAAIKLALILGIVKKDGNLIKWTATGGDLMQLTSDDNIPVQFGQYISTSEHGERILVELKRQLDRAHKKGVTPATAAPAQPAFSEPIKSTNRSNRKGKAAEEIVNTETSASSASAIGNTTVGIDSAPEDTKETRQGGLDDMIFGQQL